MSDLSLHIDCTYKWDKAKQFLASPNVKTALLYNASAEQVQYALSHCEFIVVRVYDPFRERDALGEDFEKSIVNRRQGHEFVAWLNGSEFAQFKHNKKVRFVLGWNELYSKRGIGERQQNDNIVAIAQALVDAGYGVGLGGWAADKSFYADDVNNGHWDSVIKFAVKYQDMVSVDAHEYDVLTIFNGHLISYPDGFPNTLKSAFSLNPDNHGVIPYARSEGDIEKNYKIGRIALLLQRSLDITGQSFRWYRGECAHDFKDDGSLKQFIDEWYKPRFGHPTGINSLMDYYRFLLGDSLTNEAYDELIFRQYTDLVAQDPPSCQSNFIFAWNGDRSRWLPFDVAQRPYFVSLVANHKSEGTPMPDNGYDSYDVPMAKYMVHTTNSVWNIRAEPTTNSDDIGDMPKTPTEASLSKTWVVQDSNYDWYKIDVNGIQGFTAQITGESVPNIFTPVVANPPDDGGNEPPPDSGAPSELEAFVKALEERIEAQDIEIAALKAYIEYQLEPIQIDIPLPNFTMTLPRIMQESIATAYDGLSGVNDAIAKRVRDGTQTLSQMADFTFDETVKSPTPLDDYLAQNMTQAPDAPTVSHVTIDPNDYENGTGEPLLDTMLNEGDDAA